MKILSGIAAALALLFTLTACDNAKITPANVSGYWSSGVIGAEYLELAEDGSYQTYNASGDPRFSGRYLIDDGFVVLDGENKKDESAFMILQYVDADTLQHDGLVSSNFSRVDAIGSDDGDEEPVAGEADLETWYGTYASDTGTVVIEPGSFEGHVNFSIARPPRETDDGILTAQIGSYIEVVNPGLAADETFTLELDGDTLTITALGDFGTEYAGVYKRQ